MNPLLIAFGLWQGSKLIKGKSTADKLEFFPKNLDYKDGKFYFRMEILNPTRNSLKIDSFFGGVYLNDEKLGSIEYGTPLTLAPLKRTEVRYPIIPSGLGFGKVIAKIIQGQRNFTFKVMGVARALGINNAVNEEVKLN